MNSVFNEQILAEKLSKLNNTQQCIETLSHWCIFHRSKAEQVVATWDKQFHRAGMAEKVPLLYLANDILQNSKRKGNEFVSEFWKVLPSALKAMSDKGDDQGKIVVSRLVGIWEDRRVFGSNAKNLKDVMLGDDLPAQLDFKRKRSHSVKIFKRDSRSMRTKLTIGGTPEKIVTAFHLVLSDHRSEDEEMSKCKLAIHRLRKMEEEIDAALNKKNDPKRKVVAKELLEEESILKQSIEKLKVVEANRVALVSQLRDALHEQESELESVRTQMQVAEAHVVEARKNGKHLDDENYVPSTNPTKKTTTAAEVADMLASSSSSQYIMSSVLSTFAAEEAKKVGLTPTSSSSSSMANNVDQNVLLMAPPPNNNNHLQQNNNVYQMHGQIPSNTQLSYHHPVTNSTSQQYLQQPLYGYSNLQSMTTAPPPPPPPPPPSLPPPMSYMVSPVVPLTQQQPPPPLTQQQPLHNNNNNNNNNGGSTSSNQVSILNQQQLGLVNPGYRPSYTPIPMPMSMPMPPPGMVYYANPYQSQ